MRTHGRNLLSTFSKYFHAVKRISRLKCLTAVLTVITLVFATLLVAQTTGVFDYIDAIVGWDLRNMNDSEYVSSMAILDPISVNNELSKLKSPQERSAEALASFAGTNPEAYALQYPPYKTPNELQSEARDRLAISHPREHEALLKAQKTKAELEEEALLGWIITHPNEYHELVLKTMSAEERAASERVAHESAGYPPAPPLVIRIVIPDELKPIIARELKILGGK